MIFCYMQVDPQENIIFCYIRVEPTGKYDILLHLGGTHRKIYFVTFGRKKSCSLSLQCAFVVSVHVPDSQAGSTHPCT